MKLEKREITLNEKDSVKDMYYTEKILLQGYKEGLINITRKETQLFFEERIEELKKRIRGLHSELQKE